MGTRAEVVAAARSLLGKPYHLKGATENGVDCYGLLVYAMRVTGLAIPGFETVDYTPGILAHFNKYLEPISREEMGFGDVLVQGPGGRATHLGILGDYRHGGLSIIHAEDVRKSMVVEHRLWLDGSMKFIRAYRIPGIE